MEQAVQKAAVLIEALPYIQAFQAKPIVVKLGGAGMNDEAKLKAVLRDIVFMRVVGMYPVIVHGGGPYISRAMEESGLEPQFVHGHRVTDEATLEIVERVLLSEVNCLIANALEELGGKPGPVHARLVPFLKAERKKIVPEEGGEPIEIGLVGEIQEVVPAFIEELCQVGRIPVVAPMGLGPEGELLNINADDAASRIAIALEAAKIVFFTNVPGVMEDPQDPGSLYTTLHEDEVGPLIERGTISGGMLPKVQSCLAAVHGGVHKAHIVDTRLPHSLLLEIFTQQGVGTEILK